MEVKYYAYMYVNIIESYSCQKKELGQFFFYFHSLFTTPLILEAN